MIHPLARHRGNERMPILGHFESHIGDEKNTKQSENCADFFGPKSIPDKVTFVTVMLYLLS